MITNGTAQTENYYRLRFANDISEVYAYGVNALDAIANARNDMADVELGNATARPAVHKEWNYGTERFTNGGGFTR